MSDIKLFRYANNGASVLAGTRLLCIAADFTRYDQHAMAQINRNIELVRYKLFGEDRVYFAHGFVGLLSAKIFQRLWQAEGKNDRVGEKTFKNNDDIFTNCAI
jgi:hypothetical protein